MYWNNFEKDKNVGEFTLPVFKVGCKNVWYWYEDRPIDQCSRITSPKGDPHKHG